MASWGLGWYNCYDNLTDTLSLKRDEWSSATKYKEEIIGYPVKVEPCALKLALQLKLSKPLVIRMVPSALAGSETTDGFC